MRHMRCYRYQESDSRADWSNPYRNLATEEYLVRYAGEHAAEDMAILYLWRNADCVVFGRNQNPSSECRLDLMRELGVLPVRRKTGGGAVFHDLQNLNFSFIVPRGGYDRERSMRIVAGALQSCGIDAEVNGRNDIVAGGAKVSGNAYLSKGEVCLHHGTLLIDTDTDKMERLLTVGAGKYAGRGICSVRSRVKNLKEIMPLLTAEDYGNALADRFLACYAQSGGTGFVPLVLNGRDLEAIRRIQEKYASKEWIFGHETGQAGWRQDGHFGWGNCTVQGVGRSCDIYSDTLYAEAFEQVREVVHSQCFADGSAGEIPGMEKALDVRQREMFRDICGLIGAHSDNNMEA